MSGPEKKRGPSRPGGGKRRNRSGRKELRQVAADYRQGQREALTDAEQLAKLDAAGRVATKERKRLSK
jgi:hypothetical protein